MLCSTGRGILIWLLCDLVHYLQNLKAADQRRPTPFDSFGDKATTERQFSGLLCKTKHVIRKGKCMLIKVACKCN